MATVTEVSVNKQGILIVKYISSNPNSVTQIKKLGIAPKLPIIYREFETKNIIFEVTQDYLGEVIGIFNS